MSYIDGMLAAVPDANKDAYQKASEQMGHLFRKYGAERMVECWGDEVSEGELTSMPMAVKCQPYETVVFSFIIWPSKEARNEAMPKVMAEAKSLEHNPMSLFDMQRLIHGGFIPIVDV